jgi:hypothetical protein
VSKDGAKKDPEIFVMIKDCCCGVDHRMKRSAWDKYRQVVKGKLPTVPVGTGIACWRIPRIYIACHGIKAAEVPLLAERYGWEAVGP